MKAFDASLLRSLLLATLLMVMPGLLLAQQPATPTPVPKIDPTTVTPDQVKEILQQNAQQQDQNQDTRQDDSKNKEGDKKDELEKRQKVAAPANSKYDLPIFGNEIFSNPNSTFAPSSNMAPPVNYVLGPGDGLSIAVTGNSVTSFNTVVGPDGAISLREFGKVFVGGRTLEGATEVIKEKLRSNRFAVDNGTNVDVTLTNARTIRITILGDVRTPGDYNVSSFTTVFNALYLSGGITDRGTFRGIKLIRNNEEIAHIDMYDYLLRGDMKDNKSLKEGDVILVPEYHVRVGIEGEVKRPAYFEVLPGESLRDVLRFAGGFSDYAYKFSIKAVQLTDKQQRLRDILQKDFDNYIPLKGDRYQVSSILNKFENRVSIQGAVYRPGNFELTDGLTLRELIQKADGLKEDAYTERGYIVRLKEDNSSEQIPFYVKGIMDGTTEDILLQREDVIQVSSIFDYADAYTVSIAGMVRAPGVFPYFNGMTVEDLILKGGNFADGANMVEVEIARRVKDSDRRAKDAKLANIIRIVIDPQLKLAESRFKLEPFDNVSVFSLPGYVKPQMVTIEGEVMNPGTYAMLSKDDRISDLLQRANGFTAYAYLEGASLRRGDLIETSSDAEKQSLKMMQFEEKQAQASEGKSSVNLASLTKRNNFVDINLEHILSHPKSRKDLILLDGDVLSIPRELQTVRVSGEVYSPKTTVFISGQNLSEYVLRSGGFTEDALKRDAYVVYANGASKGTRRFLFIRNYPRIEPGAEIFIPRRKPPKETNGTSLVQTWIALAASVASTAAIVFAVLNNNN